GTAVRGEVVGGGHRIGADEGRASVVAHLYVEAVVILLGGDPGAERELRRLHAAEDDARQIHGGDAEIAAGRIGAGQVGGDALAAGKRGVGAGGGSAALPGRRTGSVALERPAARAAGEVLRVDDEAGRRLVAAARHADAGGLAA